MDGIVTGKAEKSAIIFKPVITYDLSNVTLQTGYNIAGSGQYYLAESSSTKDYEYYVRINPKYKNNIILLALQNFNTSYSTLMVSYEANGSGKTALQYRVANGSNINLSVSGYPINSVLTSIEIGTLS